MYTVNYCYTYQSMYSAVLENLSSICQYGKQRFEVYNFGPNITKWISSLYNNVKSGVMNAGFMTNYFKVSRGVRQGCPLSPLLFVLAVEMLALKIRQNQLCWDIELRNGQNATISQFADNTTLILEDTTSFRNAMNMVNSFGVLSKSLVDWCFEQK